MALAARSAGLWLVEATILSRPPGATTMTNLSDTQLVLLSAAAQRDDGSLLPLPHSLGDQAGRLTRSVRALIKQALVCEQQTSDPARAWRRDGDLGYGAFITDAGRTAIGSEPLPTATPSADKTSFVSPPVKAGWKGSLVLELLKREQGATVEELTTATGWLPHTMRAALTGLRKKGHVIARGKRDEVTCYSLAPAA